MALTITTTEKVNVRSDAGVAYDRIGSIEGGRTYPVTDVKKDAEGTAWYKVEEGYISGKYTEVKEEVPTPRGRRSKRGLGSNVGGGAGGLMKSLKNSFKGIDGGAIMNKVFGDVYGGTVGSSGLGGILEGFLGAGGTGTDRANSMLSDKILGMPYQFLETTDTRGSQGNLGRVFTDNIIGEAPILSMLPCRANYMPSLSDEDKQNVIKALVDKASELTSDISKEAADAVIGEIETRYFSCEVDAVEYNKYVNTLLRSIAVFMGLGDTPVPGSGYTYSQYDWTYWRLSNFFDNSASVEAGEAPGAGEGSILGDLIDKGKKMLDDLKEMSFEDAISTFGTANYYVDFYVTPSTSYSESFSNRTEDSMFKSLLEKGEGMVKELSFLLGAGAVNSQNVMQSIGNATAEVQDAVKKMLGEDSAIARLLGNTRLIMTGSNIVFPELYHDSDYNKSYRAEIKLVAPYGTRECIFLNCMVPLAHLMAFVLPRQTSANSYSAPFLCKAHISKWFSCEMGIVDSLDIQKEDFSVDGFPTQITVSMGIKDLYSALSMGSAIMDVTNPTESLKKGVMFLQNESLMEYISVISGLNMKKSEMAIKFQLVEALLGNMNRDGWNVLQETARQGAARKAGDILRNIPILKNRPS